MDPITQLVLEGGRKGLPEAIDDFKMSPIIDGGTVSESAQQLLEHYQKPLGMVKWQKQIKGTPQHRSQYEATYQLLTATMLHNLSRIPKQTLRKEATLAGTDIPTFTKQLIRTVLRAYPDLLAPQLFPVQPLTQGPDGRVYFELIKYDSANASSAPNVNVGDVTADLTKFNTDFFQQMSQLADVGLIKLDLSNFIVVSAITYALATISSIQGQEDFSSTYGRDFNAVMSDKMAFHLKWAIDRKLILAAQAAVPAGSKVTWKRQPTLNSVVWANQAPTEKQSHQQSIWHDGFLPLMTAIYQLQYVRPNWVVAAPDVAEDIQRVSLFRPIQVSDSVIDMRQGAIRDIGTLDNGGLRVLVDPQYTTGKALFGYRPSMEMEPAIVFCPYRAIGFTDELTYPRQLKKEKAAYTRFAIAKPDVTVAESARLGYVYGELTVSTAP